MVVTLADLPRDVIDKIIAPLTRPSGPGEVANVPVNVALACKLLRGSDKDNSLRRVLTCKKFQDKIDDFYVLSGRGDILNVGMEEELAEIAYFNSPDITKFDRSLFIEEDDVIGQKYTPFAKDALYHSVCGMRDTLCITDDLLFWMFDDIMIENKTHRFPFAFDYVNNGVFDMPLSKKQVSYRIAAVVEALLRAHVKISENVMSKICLYLCQPAMIDFGYMRPVEAVVKLAIHNFGYAVLGDVIGTYTMLEEMGMLQHLLGLLKWSVIMNGEVDLVPRMEIDYVTTCDEIWSLACQGLCTSRAVSVMEYIHDVLGVDLPRPSHEFVEHDEETRGFDWRDLVENNAVSHPRILDFYVARIKPPRALIASYMIHDDDIDLQRFVGILELTDNMADAKCLTKRALCACDENCLVAEWSYFRDKLAWCMMDGGFAWHPDTLNLLSYRYISRTWNYNSGPMLVPQQVVDSVMAGFNGRQEEQLFLNLLIAVRQEPGFYAALRDRFDWLVQLGCPVPDSCDLSLVFGKSWAQSLGIRVRPDHDKMMLSMKKLKIERFRMPRKSARVLGKRAATE